MRVVTDSPSPLILPSSASPSHEVVPHDASLLRHRDELRIRTLVDMEMLPILGRIAAERVVEILALGQVSLHLLVLCTNHLLVILVREVEAAAVVVELIVEERVQSVHDTFWGSARVPLGLLLRFPLIIGRPVLTLGVGQLRHLCIVVVLYCCITGFKIKRLSLFKRKFLLLSELLPLSLGDSRLIIGRHRKPRVVKHKLS